MYLLTKCIVSWLGDEVSVCRRGQVFQHEAHTALHRQQQHRRGAAWCSTKKITCLPPIGRDMMVKDV